MADEIKEKEIEAGNTSPASPMVSDFAPEESKELKEFAPINNPLQTRGTNDSLARVPTSLRSISRTRSNNGYGCDNPEDTDGSGDFEGGDGGVQVEKDPYEVKWEGGDNDKMNPRSLGLGRKWVVVLIVSASSLCV
jgi:hypothetical protein